MGRTIPAQITRVGGLDDAPVAAQTSSCGGTSCFTPVSPKGYFIVALLFAFTGGLLLYLELSFEAAIVLGLACVAVPYSWWFDRLVLTGGEITRTGFVAFLRERLLNKPQSLKIGDIELIETGVFRVFRGGKVYNRYQSEIRAGATCFSFASNGRAGRQLVAALFPLVAPDKLDLRSLELRDNSAAPKAIRLRAAALQLPSAEILESCLKNLRRRRRNPKQIVSLLGGTSNQKFDDLRGIAGELRILGELPQATEAARRVLLRRPRDPASLFEFAQSLHLYTASTGSARLQRRALAALRLAARYAREDSGLLARIGESCLEIGNTKLATTIFQCALKTQPENFRAERNLAEIALRAGKLAHVAHHFRNAARATIEQPLCEWARAEADYFVLLGSDGDYLRQEIARINWRQSVVRGKRVCSQLAAAGLSTVVLGHFLEPDLTAVGWAFAVANAITWTGLALATRLLSKRSSSIAIGQM